jgi:hypothetical protein
MDDNMYTIRRKNKTFLYYNPNIYYNPNNEKYNNSSDSDNDSESDIDISDTYSDIIIDTEDVSTKIDDKSINTTSSIFTQSTEESIEYKELFKDNLECVDGCNCIDLDIIDDYTDYEIINESNCIPIKNRYRKQTWYEYFRKLYMVTVILIVSIVIYFYYSYSNRRENVISKL